MKKTTTRKSAIKDVVIAVTYRCNSRCRMCNIWQAKDFSGELTAEDFNNLPRNLKNINLSGGEPFLRMDLPQIVSVVKKRCPQVRITISSNGFATEIILEKIKEILKIDPQISVALSLDGVGAAHEAVRNIPGAYDKTMKTLRGLQDSGVKNLRLAFTIGDYNIPELKRVYELSQKEGVEMTIAAVHSSDNFFNKTNELKALPAITAELSWLLKKELSAWNIKRWLRAYFIHGLIEFIKTGRRILPDYSGADNCFIDPRGNIYPCDISLSQIGNLKQGFALRPNETQACSHSWMICTARMAMRRHWFEVGMWI
ncbi:MAG: radical SAM protein, partial [Patescibacteria group bacterium]|nr:radical SAM protein [Patescibacteria group bacterium]